MIAFMTWLFSKSSSFIRPHNFRKPMVLQISALDSEPIFADALNKMRIRVVVGVLLTVLKGTQKSILPSPFQWQRELQNFFFLLWSLRIRLLYLANWVGWNNFNKDLTLIYFIIVTFPFLSTEPLNKVAQTTQQRALPQNHINNCKHALISRLKIHLPTLPTSLLTPVS